MTTIRKYRVRCLTDNKYEYVWGETTPTTCPTDTDHTIDFEVHIVKKVTDKKIKIQEETVETGGNFCSTSLEINATKNSATCAYVEWPNNISALAMEVISEEAHRGDVIDLFVVKDVPVGGLLANVAPGNSWTEQNYATGQTVTYNNRTYTCITDTVSNEIPTNTTYWKRGIELTVTSTVIQNVKNGYFLSLFDQVNMNNVGRIISIDAVNSKVFVETDVTNSFSFMTPTTVLLSVKSIHDYKLGAPWNHIFGASAIGGSHIPADTPVTICYTNNSTDTDKVLIGTVSYLY